MWFYHLLRSHWPPNGIKTPFKVPHYPQTYWELDLIALYRRINVIERVLHPRHLKQTSEVLPCEQAGGADHREKLRTGI